MEAILAAVDSIASAPATLKRNHKRKVARAEGRLL